MKLLNQHTLKYLLIISLLLGSYTTKAQSKTFLSQLSEESYTTLGFSIPAPLTINNSNEKIGGIGLKLAFENKLNNSFSLAVIPSYYYFGIGSSSSDNTIKGVQIPSASVAIKYYPKAGFFISPEAGFSILFIRSKSSAISFEHTLESKRGLNFAGSIGYTHILKNDKIIEYFLKYNYIAMDEGEFMRFLSFNMSFSL